MIQISSPLPSHLLADQLAVGEECMPRNDIHSEFVSTTSGFLRLSLWTARKTETTTQVRMYSGATAAGATPTLCRIGLYLFDASGDAALVASTANDTTLFAAVGGTYTRSWTTPYEKIRGRRYGVGALVVTAATTPTFLGKLVSPGAEFGIAPVMGLVYTGLADLPANLVGASGIANGFRPYAAILP